MISQREVERQYNKMLSTVKKELPSDRVNCYVCDDCNHITKTIDIDNGTTPFIHQCESCNGMAKSTFYRDIAPAAKPTQEWFRPTLEQTMKYRNKPGILEHILMGGLDIRKVKQL